ncbi:hypothetical protein niasHT_029541 [Heterodera trifolii]|uniref:Secreted protein n=1 Tax=Heterodera trifolii TaxID=157864 RepID=A0ABD2JB35_9BILA
MEFARRRPMLSAPFGALLGAVVAVAVLLPSHCNVEEGIRTFQSQAEILCSSIFRHFRPKKSRAGFNTISSTVIRPSQQSGKNCREKEHKIVLLFRGKVRPKVNTDF